MSEILPVALTVEDIVSSRLVSIGKYLAARGDPNALLPFSLHSITLTQDEDSMSTLCSETVRGSSISLGSLRRAQIASSAVATNASLLQLASFLENRNLVMLLFSKKQRPMWIAAPSSSLLPSPLYLAVMYKKGTHSCSYGSALVTETLLSQGVDADGCDELTVPGTRPTITPLHIAALQNNTRIFELLLKAGASVAHETKILLRCIAHACSVGCLVAARKGASREHLVDDVLSGSEGALDSMQRTALHIAVLSNAGHHPDQLFDWEADGEPEERRVTFVLFVAALGCPVDAQDFEGNTALHMAWRLGNARLSHALITQCGARTDILNFRGCMPLECHPLGVSPLSVVFYGGLSGITQPTRPLSTAGFASLVLDCAPVESLMLQVVNPRDHRHVLHVLFGNPYLFDHHNTTAILSVVERILRVAEQTVFATRREFLAWLDAPGGDDNVAPLHCALENGLPLAVVELLLSFGANPCLPCGVTYRRWNAFQLLASITQPCDHIGDMALLLLQYSGAELDSLPTHPTHSHHSILDVPIVQQHPSWATFVETVSPPQSEKIRRAREAQRFGLYHEGVIDSIVPSTNVPLSERQVSALQLLRQAEERFTGLPTALDRLDDDQGAYLMSLIPTSKPPRQASDEPSAELNVHEKVNIMTPAEIVSLSTQTHDSFRKLVDNVVSSYDAAQLSARNFTYEQLLAQAEKEDMQSTFVRGPADDERIIDSLPFGSLLQSFWIARALEAEEYRCTAQAADELWRCIWAARNTCRLAVRGKEHMRAVEECYYRDSLRAEAKEKDLIKKSYLLP